MPNYAHIQIAGHVGQDPKSRQIQGGKTVTSFSVGVSTGWKDKKTTTWYSVTVFGPPAEWAARDLRKGDAVFVSGEPSMEKWRDREGKERETLKVTVGIGGTFFKIPKDQDRQQTFGSQGQGGDDEVPF